MAALDFNVPTQKEQLRRLFRVKRVEGEMLRERGFSLTRVYMHLLDSEKKHNFTREIDLNFLQDPLFTFEQFLERRQAIGLFGNRQDFSSIYYKFNDSGQVIDGVMALYLNNEPGKKVNKEHFTIVTTYIQTQIFRHFILVTETGLGNNSAKFIKDRSVGYLIEVFRDVELGFNRTKHALAPINIRHVPSVEMKGVAADEGIQPEKLPLIFNTDPISKWYGARPLDMFVTEIVGTTTDSAGYYRLVRTFNEKKVGKETGKRGAPKK